MKSISKNSFDTLFNNNCPYTFTNGLSTTIEDLRVIVSLCRYFKSENVLELGVRYGHTAKFILEQCPGIKKYIGVDVPVSFIPENEIQKLEIPLQTGIIASFDKRFEAVVLDNGTKDIEDDINLFGCRFDLIFVDADHSLNGVKRDTGISKRLVKSGGIVIWHDYTNEKGVTDFLDSISGDNDIVHVEGSLCCFMVC